MNPTSLVTLVPSNDSDSAELFAFSDAVVVSEWWTTLATVYGLDPAPTSLHLVGPPIDTDLARNEVIDYITATIGDAGVVARTGSRLYLLYLPASSAISISTPADTTADTPTRHRASEMSSRSYSSATSTPNRPSNTGR